MESSIFLCYPRALLTSLTLPMEMIDAANSVARLKRSKGPRWRTTLVASDKKRMAEHGFAQGLRLQCDFDLENAPPADTLFVPPIWGNPMAVIRQNAPLLKWLQHRFQQGAQLVATGTGVCLLAEAGLLDGKVATTHWYYFEQFARRYPSVNLQRRHFITQAGRIFCCGSINSLVDLTLYFIERNFNKTVSHVIEQHFSHEINRTFDKPWYTPGAARHPDEGIIEVQQWMQQNIQRPFHLPELAKRANMSVRNFSRRFKKAVGTSPLQYGIDIKLQTARELLKETNLSHQEIADHIGFKDVAYFARLFRKKFDLNPGQYRKMVRGKLFAIDTHTGQD